MGQHGVHILCRHSMHTRHGTLSTKNAAACICQAALCNSWRCAGFLGHACRGDLRTTFIVCRQGRMCSRTGRMLNGQCIASSSLHLLPASDCGVALWEASFARALIWRIQGLLATHAAGRSRKFSKMGQACCALGGQQSQGTWLGPACIGRHWVAPHLYRDRLTGQKADSSA